MRMPKDPIADGADYPTAWRPARVGLSGTHPAFCNVARARSVVPPGRSPARGPLESNPTTLPTMARMTAPLPDRNDIRIAIIGLGYVGLPLAATFGRSYPTLGFDIDAARIEELRQHRDHTLEMTEEELKASTRLAFSSDPAG